MIQPKYSPEEALKRIKLMMEYDTSKTYTENKQVLKEQDYLPATATAVPVGAGAGLTAAALGAGTLAGGYAGTAAMAVGSALGATAGSGAALALGASVIGGAAALALTPLVVWYMDKDEAKPKVQRIIQYCQTDFDKISKVPRGISDGEVRNLSDQLYDAMKGLGTDEEAVYNAFKSLKSASDFCALVARFNSDYGGEGDLMEWLDDDFDATSEWMQIFRPLRDIVEDTLLTIKDEKKEEEVKKDEEKKKTETTTSWRNCQSVYQKGCKSDVIREVQSCLGGIAVDGKFGSQTERKLNEKFPELKGVFRDSDVTKICGNASDEDPYADYTSVETSDINKPASDVSSAAVTDVEPD